MIHVIAERSAAESRCVCRVMNTRSRFCYQLMKKCADVLNQPTAVKLFRTTSQTEPCRPADESPPTSRIVFHVSQEAEAQDPPIALNARLSSAAPATPALNLTRHELNTRDTRGSGEIDADNRLTAERTQASTTLRRRGGPALNAFIFPVLAVKSGEGGGGDHTRRAA